MVVVEPSYCEDLDFDDLVDMELTDSHDLYRQLMSTVIII